MTTTTSGSATDLITFSRGSLATVTDSNGYIKWAPHNLLLASEQFDASYWTKTGSTLAANNVVSPNGTTTADTLTASAGSSTHCLFSAGVTIETATNYTYAAFLKKGTHNYATIIALSGSTSWVAITVDFSGSSPVISQTGAGAGGTYVTSGIEAVSNGFYRVWFTASLTVAPVQMEIALSSTATPTYGSYGEVSWSAAGTETIALWGAHLYRSDLGGMQANASAYPYYNPSTPKNLLGYSEAFDNAAWTKANTTVTANAIAAPNGSLSADKIIENTSNISHVVIQDVTTTASPYTFSAYLKAAGRNWAVLYNVTASRYASFNLSTGTTGFTSAGTTTSITPVGDGWYRCSIKGDATAASNSFRIYLADADNSISYTGDGTSGIYLWGAQLSDSASLDPYVGSYGAAPSPAAAYGPRLDYDPSTLAAKGLLVEEQRTNLLTYSDDFSNAAWTKTQVTLTANNTTAPDGAVTADKIVDSAVNSEHGLYATSTLTAVPYTFSVYLKNDNAGYARISLATASAAFGVGVFVNLSAGTIGSTIVYGGATGASSAIVSAGNGWYRVSVTVTGTAATYYPAVSISLNGTTTTYTGDGTKGIYLYGAQLEAEAFATSYIPTAAATVTRNADVASVATSQFPLGSTEGTIVTSATPIGFNVANFITTLQDASLNNFVQHYYQSATNLRVNVVASGGIVAEFDNAVVMGATHKVATAFKANDFASSFNGGSSQTDNTGTAPTGFTTLNIGRRSDGFTLNGHIRQITYIPRRLTNAELISRST